MSKLGRYISAAFSARPLGMPIPPNWIGIGAFCILGFLNPGLWLVGAGLELAYLILLSGNERFRAVVDARDRHAVSAEGAKRLDAMKARLSDLDKDRYDALESRCRQILSEQPDTARDAATMQTDGLGKLLWVYLQLLVMRQSIVKVLTEQAGVGGDSAQAAARYAELQTRLKQHSLEPDLKRSIESQAEILAQRIQSRREARDKLEFIEAELTRVEEQVQLIREQCLLATSHEAMSDRIDSITSTLGTTTQWIHDQSRLYGVIEGVNDEAPPILAAPSIKA